MHMVLYVLGLNSVLALCFLALNILETPQQHSDERTLMS
jgi:hypothetical protein